MIATEFTDDIKLTLETMEIKGTEDFFWLEESKSSYKLWD